MDLTPDDRKRVRSVDINSNRDKLLTDWRKEIDGFYAVMDTFSAMDPSDIFRSLSSMSSRMSYIRGQIVRSENRQWGNFRTKEIDPFIAECDRQFKLWSRCFTTATLDWEMSKGY